MQVPFTSSVRLWCVQSFFFPFSENPLREYYSVSLFSSRWGPFPSFFSLLRTKTDFRGRTLAWPSFLFSPFFISPLASRENPVFPFSLGILAISPRAGFFFLDKNIPPRELVVPFRISPFPFRCPSSPLLRPYGCSPHSQSHALFFRSGSEAFPQPGNVSSLGLFPFMEIPKKKLWSRPRGFLGIRFPSHLLGPPLFFRLDPFF